MLFDYADAALPPLLFRFSFMIFFAATLIFFAITPLSFFADAFLTLRLLMPLSPSMMPSSPFFHFR